MYNQTPMPPPYPPRPSTSAPHQPAPPSPPQRYPGERRTGAFGVLIFCVVMLIAVLFISATALTVLGVNIQRADNGSLMLWVGPQSPLVVVSMPPAEPVADTEPSANMSAKDIYKKISPAVVGILARGADIYSGSSGTGMIISDNGYILTNHHVVDGFSSISVVFSDGTEVPATIIGSDYISDIAVIKINGSGLPVVELGQSELMSTGDKCYAIGNPLGMELQNTMTDGMISAVARDITLYDRAYGEISMTVLQTNCAVNPGNSGGPLINEYGQVIGIISSKIMGDSYSAVEGLGFAIPMDTAIPIITSILDYGYVRGRPMIGITAASTQLSEQAAADLGLPVGVLIGSVNERSDAYAKGIRKGDIVTHVNGEAVTTVAEINQIKNKFRAGDTLLMTVFRDGVTYEVDILLMDSADN